MNSAPRCVPITTRWRRCARRLGALKADPWEGFFEKAVPLSAAMLQAVGVQLRSETDE